ncbi:MAG: hypothetical protein ABWY06_16430 [Pseudomonas sp.]
MSDPDNTLNEPESKNQQAPLTPLPDEVVENLEKQAPLPAPIPDPGPM